MTRNEIEEAINDALNRSDLTAQVSFWFDTAYHELQRLHNFEAMEDTAILSPLVLDSYNIEAPGDIKKSLELSLYDPVRGHSITFYQRTSIEMIRHIRITSSPDSPWDTVGYPRDGRRFYASWKGFFELYPRISGDDVTKVLHFDYYKYLESPEEEESDWFTDHAFDYIKYRALRESAPFLGADERLKTWYDQEQAAYNSIIGSDIDEQISGPLQLRG